MHAGVHAGTPHYSHLMAETGGENPNIQRTPAPPRCWADVLGRLSCLPRTRHYFRDEETEVEEVK